jgi:GNAT superfamily N-acetyltransferase
MSENVSEITATSRDQMHALCEEFSNEFDDFVRERFRYKKRTVTRNLGNTLNVFRAPVDIYLRFRPRATWPADSIVIARTGFAKQRKGHGTALLRFLVERAPRYGIRSIGIEQTHDGEDIMGFVDKFGFAMRGDQRNWIASIDELRERLSME